MKHLMIDYDYDNTTTSTGKSRSYLKIAAAYANVAMKSRPDLKELKECLPGTVNEVTARAFAVMTNLAFALEVALKGKLPSERESNILSRRKGHDLKVLFQNLPKCDQEQIKISVMNILLMDENLFEEYMEICKNGFVEWRYFFEEKKSGKSYKYLTITLFLYALVYCLITGEGFSNLLEPCDFKKQCYVGEWGFFRRVQTIKKEYDDARKLALEEGNGIISSEDEEWLRGIETRLAEVQEDIKRVENSYYEENEKLKRNKTQ